MYMYARYMDPRTGRFLSEDPVGNGDLYSYAMNDPMNVWDPFGAVVAVEYGTQSSSSQKTTSSGAVPIGCRVKCMLMTTADGIAFANSLSPVDGVLLAVDWAKCAFGADPGYCFPKNTSIQAARGSAAIQDLEVGDRVLAMEEDDSDWVTVAIRPGVGAVRDEDAAVEVRDE